MPEECFVYIVLPGESKFTTAGKFNLTPDRHDMPTGRFVYGRSYVARPNAVALDPAELVLRKDTFRTTGLKGVFGALRDSSPDYWGRRLMEKHAGRQPLGELDYLLESSDDRAGALGFGLNVEPSAPRRHFNQTLALETLQQIADAVMRDENAETAAVEPQIRDLALLGTSMGGARPKAVVEDEDGLWLAKFNRAEDPWNMARVEHAMLVLARQCGITAADSRVERVAGRDVLLVKRFDREKAEDGYRRARMMSALTLLRAQDTYGDRDKWSYVALVEELRRLCAQPRRDAAELFCRMCFNALISNTDDHPRNHAVIAWTKDWELSPAYDLTPTTPVSLERRDLALIAGDRGRYAHAENLLSQSSRFLLHPREARALVDGMERQVRSTWHEVARGQGVSERDCERLQSAFAYPGFRLPAAA